MNSTENLTRLDDEVRYLNHLKIFDESKRPLKSILKSRSSNFETRSDSHSQDSTEQWENEHHQRVYPRFQQPEDEFRVPFEDNALGKSYRRAHRKQYKQGTLPKKQQRKADARKAKVKSNSRDVGGHYKLWTLEQETEWWAVAEPHEIEAYVEAKNNRKELERIAADAKREREEKEQAAQEARKIITKRRREVAIYIKPAEQQELASNMGRTFKEKLQNIVGMGTLDTSELYLSLQNIKFLEQHVYMSPGSLEM